MLLAAQSCAPPLLCTGGPVLTGCTTHQLAGFGYCGGFSPSRLLLHLSLQDLLLHFPASAMLKQMLLHLHLVLAPSALCRFLVPRSLQILSRDSGPF